MINKYSTIIFDLDGTLVDPSLGIINSAYFSLKKMGIKVNKKFSLKSFIGPSLDSSFSNFFSSKKDIQRAIDYFFEFYSKNWRFDYRVYNYIDMLLKRLKQNNKNLALATTNSFANSIINYFNFDHYFKIVASTTANKRNIKKKNLIKKIITNLNIEPSSVIMIGDTKYDQIGASQNRIDFIWASYGYGNKSDFLELKTDLIADSPKKLLQLFI